MKSSWPIKSIGECSSPDNYSTQIGPFGKALMSNEYTSSGVPVLRGINVNKGRFFDDDFVFISQQKAALLEKFKSEPGDILLVHKGTLGKIAIMPKNRKYEKYILGNSMMKVKCDQRVLLPDYLYYWLNSRDGQNYIFSRVSQVGVPQIQRPLSTLREAKLSVPPISYQKKVVKILSNLDEKIELNHLINEKLEYIAKSIFKSWFLDFDPVYAKKNALEAGLTKAQSERAAMAIISGVCSPVEFTESFNEMDKRLEQKLSKMSKKKHEELEYTASLFPTDFEESEKSTLPTLWNIKKISDVSDVIGGGTPSTKIESYFCQKGTGIPWISPKDLSGYQWKFIEYGATDITQLGLEKSSAKLLPAGSVLISSRAPIGYISIAEKELSTNQGFKSLVPSVEIGTNYLYCWAKQNIYKMEAVATGSTFKEISGSNMKNLDVVVPTKELLRNFEDLVDSIFEFQKNLRHETVNLEKTRDLLIPKLLAGEVDLSNINIQECD